jgi:phenylacetate-CoA ligase
MMKAEYDLPVVKTTPLEDWTRAHLGIDSNVPLRPKLSDWTIAQFNQTLKLARSHSPFYRQHLASAPQNISCMEEIAALPLMDASHLRTQALQLLCVSQDEIKRVVTLQTSGTSGEPKRIFFTAADQQLTIDFFSAGMSTFTGPGDHVLILLPCQPPGSVGDLLRLALLKNGSCPLAHGVHPDPTETLALIGESRVACLVASPTQALALAARWPQEAPPPRSVLLSTDSISPAVVRRLEQTWGCEVYNHYGMTEMGLGGGVECAAHRGLHLREHDLFFEMINPRTLRPALPGDYGEIVFSTLTRQGMPLIRYRTGDRGRFLPGVCPCGTELRTLERVRARLDGFFDLFGQNIYLADFDDVLFAHPAVLDFSAELGGSSGAPLVNLTVITHDSTFTASAITNLLETSAELRNLPSHIEVHYCPLTIGTLKKRLLIDKRGQYA